MLNENNRKILRFLSFMTIASVALCLSVGKTALAETPQREAFIKAHKDIKKGRSYNSDSFKNYLLYSYLDYQYLKKQHKKISDQRLIQFVNNNQDNWLGESINTVLLERLVKQKLWHEINQYYKKGKGGVKSHCVALEAQLQIRLTQQRLNEAAKLWKSANSRPKVCNSLFKILKQQGILTDRLAWERITLTMKKGKTTLSRQLSKHLYDPSLVPLWINLRKNPDKYLNNKRLKKDDQRNRQLIAYAIKRSARKDTDKALSMWKRFNRTHRFTAKTKAEVDSYIGVRDAKDHKARALSALKIIPSQYRSEEATLWLARMALRYGDWQSLHTAINTMSVSERKRERWRYWHALSGKYLGNQNIKPHLQSIAKNASFYGFLAADEINAPYARLLQPERNWRAEMHRVKNIPAIKRARELFAIGMPKYATREWRWAVQRLNKDDQLIAAAYAHEINQPFTAIITVSGTKQWNQTGLRFPLKYKNLVISSAHKHRIEPAWVYGIMRRESAFDPVIKSHANARGLMQVLPATARGVAKSLGIRHRTSDLLNPKKNTNIGAAYLSQMLKRFDGNMIKATAAYNAGPYRIPRWLPEQTISAPQWFESIPFDETRDYVRAVLSYTTIYDHKLHYRNGTNRRLSERLMSIGPK